MDNLHLKSREKEVQKHLFFIGNVAFYLFFDMMKEGKQRKGSE